MSARAEENVVIRNIYIMMAYAFRALELRELSRLAEESFDNFSSLLAAILSIGIANQRKRGLERDYVTLSDELTQPKGSINVRETILLKRRGRLKASCEYDEYAFDTVMNRVLKTCALSLVGNPEVRDDLRALLKRQVMEMSEVGTISDIRRFDWTKLQYHRNNRGYLFLMNACYMCTHRLIPSSEQGDIEQGVFVDAQRLHALYEKFILEYYRREHPEIRASAKVLPSPPDAPSFLPRLCSDITLESGGKVLIIDAKCYGRIMSVHNGREMMSPANRHQIVDYVVHEAYGSSKVVSGMLLYALTEKEASIHESWRDIGHRFYLWTLDLGADFSGIASTLDEAAAIVSG